MPREAEQEDDDTLIIEVDEDDGEGAEGAGAGSGEGQGEDAPDAQAEKLAESVASLMGWKPKEKWKGDETGWRSATDFLKEVPEVLRNTRKGKDHFEHKLARVVAEVSRLSANQRAQLDANLEADLEAAVEAGDKEGAKKILAAMRATAPSNEEPALTAFKDRNEWFGVDDEATAYAAALDAQYAKGGISDPDAHMRKVEAGVKKRFPELFGAPAASDEERKAKEEPGRRAPLVSRGGRVAQRQSNGEVTAADLTPAQRKAAADFGLTPERYAKSLNELNKKDRAA